MVTITFVDQIHDIHLQKMENLQQNQL